MSAAECSTSAGSTSKDLILPQERHKCPFCKAKYDRDTLLYHLSNEHEHFIVKNGEFIFSMVGERRYLIVIQENHIENHILCIAIQVMENVTVFFNLLVTEKEESLERFSIKVFDEYWKELIPQCELNTDPSYFPLNNDKFYKTFFEFENDPFVTYNNYVVMQNSVWQQFSNRAYDNWLCKVDLKESLAKSNFRIVNIINMLYNLEILSEIDSDSLKSFLLNHKDEFHSCNNCKLFVQTEFYLCPSYHLACKNCISRKCVKCNNFSPWSNKTKLHQITLSCGFKNCNERPHIFDYFRHTQNCKFRQYLCPDHKCSFVGLYDKFIDHWHLGDICKWSEITLYIGEQKFWFLPTKDLVIINFEDSNDEIRICSIMEYNGNLTQNYQFNFFSGFPERTLIVQKNETKTEETYPKIVMKKQGMYGGLLFTFADAVKRYDCIQVKITCSA